MSSTEGRGRSKTGVVSPRLPPCWVQPHPLPPDVSTDELVARCLDTDDVATALGTPSSNIERPATRL
jgi:hypothetical protein